MKNHKKFSKHFTLHVETLRVLDRAALANANGGETTTTVITQGKVSSAACDQ
jgi:hypothetical protein